MYGAGFNFDEVTLPGVGGQINASNAISSDQLAAMNKTGRKWRTDEDGNMVFHNEALLERNQIQRAGREHLVNRSRNENELSVTAMAEIFGMKRARAAAFRETKKNEYNFSGPGSDFEVLSIPQPFSEGEACSNYKSCDCAPCKAKTKAKKELEFKLAETKCASTSNCNCIHCRNRKQKDMAFREWSDSKRQTLVSGELKGRFAGPNQSFPIAGPEDVSAAWSSVGRAANPRKIMASIIKIAKEFGWESGLPQTVKDRLANNESGLPH